MPIPTLTLTPSGQVVFLPDGGDGPALSLLTMKRVSRLPGWCGVGEPQTGYYANMPGNVFAKVLREMWTNVVPTFGYWSHTKVHSDSRLAAWQATGAATCSIRRVVPCG